MRLRHLIPAILCVLLVLVDAPSSLAAQQPIRGDLVRPLVVEDGQVVRRAVVKFTNNKRVSVKIQVGRYSNARPDATKTVAPGSSVSFTTSRKTLQIQEQGRSFFAQGSLNTRTGKASYVVGQSDYAAW